MRWRSLPFSRLGVLELDDQTVSLRSARGSPLFAVPATSVGARETNKVAVHQYFFEVVAAGRRWTLAPWVPTKYTRRSTKALVERFRAREVVPLPASMGEDAYHQVMNDPIRHQLLWKGFWVSVLNSPRGTAPTS
jgi:hypothetical protein